MGEEQQRNAKGSMVALMQAGYSWQALSHGMGRRVEGPFLSLLCALFTFCVLAEQRGTCV